VEVTRCPTGRRLEPICEDHSVYKVDLKILPPVVDEVVVIDSKTKADSTDPPI